MNVWAKNAAHALAVGFLCTFSVNADEDIIWYDYPASGVVLGQGFDMLAGRPTHGTCVTFVPVQDPSQEIRYKFEEVNSHTEIQSVTNISASGAMRMAILKANARLSYLSDEKFTRDTSKFWLNATVTNSALFTAPSLGFKQAVAVLGNKPDGSPIDYSNIDKIDFTNEQDKNNINKCGHGFVGVIISGAALDSFLTFEKDNSDSKANIAGGLEADIAGIFTVKGSFEQRQAAVTRQDSTKITLYRYGGSGGNIAYDLNGLKESVKALTKEAASTPKPVSIGIVPYSLLDQLPRPIGVGADRFSDAVAAYFLALDVFSKTEDYIEYYFNHEKNKLNRDKNSMPIYLATNLEAYVDLNAKALQEANRLSRILAFCRDEAESVNDEISAAPAEDREGLFGKLDPTSTSTNSGARLFSIDSVRALSADNTATTFESTLLTLLNREAPTAGALRKEDNREEALSNCLVSSSAGGSFLNEAPDRAISLVAEEISLRPIYWNDLGDLYKSKLRLVQEKFNAGQDPNDLQGEVLEILKQYNAVYRSAGLRRTICRRSFAHPICRIKQSEFSELAAFPTIDVLIDFAQLEVEAQ